MKIQKVRFYHHLGFQIAFVFGCCMSIMAIIISWASYAERFNSLAEHLEAEGKETASLIAVDAATHILVGDIASIEHNLLNFASDVDINDIVVVDEQGNTLSKVSRDGEGLIKVQFESQQFELPKEIELKYQRTKNELQVWSPIGLESSLGWVKISYSLSRQKAAYISAVRNSFVSSLLAFVISGLILLLVLNPRLKVLSQIASKADQMGKSNKRLVDYSQYSYEISQLCDAINTASQNMYSQHEKNKSDQKFIELLLNSAPVAIVGVDHSGTCLFHNPRFLQLCFYNEQVNLIGTQILDEIFPLESSPNSHSNIQLELEDVMREGTAIHIESEYFRQDNSLSLCEVWAHPIKNESSIFGAVLSFVDIKQRVALSEQAKKLQDQLQHAQKMEAIGQLTGGIAHDFNNILAAISGYTLLLASRVQSYDDKKLKTYLDEISVSSDRAAQLVKKMLAFGRKSKGDFKRIELSSILTEVESMLSPILPSSIDFQTKIATESAQILADPIQLQQILTNLCINAKDAIAGSGCINVNMALNEKISGRCSSCGEDVSGIFHTISVNDNGEGIDANQINRVFEPFFTTKDIGKGSGMGLSMVHGLVHENNGHIVATSELGQGAEFKLLLPIQAYPENHQTKVEVQNLLLQEQVYTHFDKPAKILIVDDNKSVANFLCELFVGAGYNATASTNSLDAFEHFSKNPEMFDLIITDQTMPNLSGFELARLILKIKPNLPIVLCTGYSEHIDKETALALGIRSYHNKPINPSLLFNTVNELLNSAA